MCCDIACLSYYTLPGLRVIGQRDSTKRAKLVRKISHSIVVYSISHLYQCPLPYPTNVCLSAIGFEAGTLGGVWSKARNLFPRCDSKDSPSAGLYMVRIPNPASCLRVCAPAAGDCDPRKDTFCLPGGSMLIGLRLSGRSYLSCACETYLYRTEVGTMPLVSATTRSRSAYLSCTDSRFTSFFPLVPFLRLCHK